LGKGYKIDSAQFSFGYAYTFRRDFDNGIVIYSQYPHTVQLDTTYKKILGVDPDNDGSDVDSIIFDQDRMGIFLVRKDINVSIKTIDDSDNIKIYPNPTTGDLIIDAKKVKSIEVYNSIGSLVSNYKNTNKISIKNLPNGIYILSITIENNRTIKKIIKK
jgi:hypothetical protein